MAGERARDSIGIVGLIVPEVLGWARHNVVDPRADDARRNRDCAEVSNLPRCTAASTPPALPDYHRPIRQRDGV